MVHGGICVDHSDIFQAYSRCIARDPEGLEQLFAATAPQLLAQCLQELGNRAVADEALVDIYCAIWDEGAPCETGETVLRHLETRTAEIAADRAAALPAQAPAQTSRIAQIAPDPTTWPAIEHRLFAPDNSRAGTIMKSMAWMLFSGLATALFAYWVLTYAAPPQ